ncbi:MAG: hypothetical protein Q9166_007649 [cf. Caloplaca sp. 2 TL-2023]
MANIKFIPPQTGPVTNYTTRALRSGPLWLLLKDTGILITVLPYLPLLFFPLNTKAKDEKQKSASQFKSSRDTAIQVLLFLLQTILLVLFVPALISLPVFLFAAAALLCILIFRLIAWPTQGPRILHSSVPASTSPTADRHSRERWVFINGICTGSSGLQANIDRLSLLFGRQVLGIHNESYGMISDLLECLLQRCMSYNTLDVRVTCEVIKDYLVDEQVEKLVLEIYTFGSAASHFHNPPIASTSASTATASSSTSPAHANTNIIRHIEHYANEFDMVPRWGVLYAVSNLVNNRYAGSVFVRAGASGHMFVDHYLDPMFPLGKHQASKAVVKIKNRQASGNNRANGFINPVNDQVEEARSYLDAIVDVDDIIPLKRRTSSPPKSLIPSSMQMKGRKNPGTRESHDIPAINGNGLINCQVMVNGCDITDEDLVMEQQARGKMVKDLSRLWLYLGGNSPED